MSLLKNISVVRDAEKQTELCAYSYKFDNGHGSMMLKNDDDDNDVVCLKIDEELY